MSRSQYLSDVYLYGQDDDKGFPIDTVTVTIEAGMKSGAVLALVSGKYVWVASATVANAVAVLADERADAGLTAGDHTLKVVARNAGVGRKYLTFKGSVTTGQVATAEAALLAKGIKTESQA